MFQKAPNWRDIFNDPTKTMELFRKSSIETQKLIKKANSEYLHWDKFRYQKMPEGVDPKVAWALLKIARMGGQEFVPLLDENQRPFSIYLAKDQLRDISYIDSNTSGVIATVESMPDETQQNRLVINGLMEEAISSSQMEGASTTRKVAKAMIELKREPKSTDEKMILNNYHAMSRLEEWKARDLDDNFLLELHKVITVGTLENSNDEGKFRVDDDEINVVDRLTGEILHVPPKIDKARVQLKQLYAFANADDDDDNYVHPFVKATILHFYLGYVHPFVDGNGRCARALFYWYLIKKNYWMFKFLPISLQIKKKEWRPGYERAFKYVETDEGDITYFLTYKLKVARNAIEDFLTYLKRKQKEDAALKEKLVRDETVNHRQLDAIDFMKRNSGLEIDVQAHKDRHKIAYETARSDLQHLASKGILRQVKRGKKYVFARGSNFPVT